MATASSGQGTVPPSAPGGPLAALPRSVLLILGSAAAIVAAAGIRGAAGIVAPVVLSLILTIAVLPVAGWARHRGWPSWLGTLLALVCAYAIVLVFYLGLALAVVKLADQLPQYADSASRVTGDIKRSLTSSGVSADRATTVASQPLSARLIGTHSVFHSGRERMTMISAPV